MKIQRFTADDMPSALRAARRRLGAEAVILEAKAVTEQGRRRVTVVAALDRHPGQPAPLPPPHESPVTPPRRRAQPPLRPSVQEAPPPREPAASAPDDERAALQRRLAYLNRLVASDHFSHLPIPLREIYLDLIAADVDSNLSFGLLRAIAERGPVDLMTPPDLEPLAARFAALLPAARVRPGEEAGRVLLLVGPPGAGKTTVAAALAARAVRRGLHPGLVSIDTFTAGGSARLEQYARILDLPCTTAFTPDELAGATGARLAACDLLIVDGPAIVHGDPAAAASLEGFCDALTDPELHLVLPASGKVADLARIQAAHDPWQPRTLIFTQVDQTTARGGILSVSIKARCPVSYWLAGRDIVSDLQPADPAALVALVFGTGAAGQDAAPQMRRRALA